MDSTTQILRTILKDTLLLSDEYLDQANAPLLDAVPQLDSATVLQILLSIEEQFSISIPDDEIGAEQFVDFNSLLAFVNEQLPTAS